MNYTLDNKAQRLFRKTTQEAIRPMRQETRTDDTLTRDMKEAVTDIFDYSEKKDGFAGMLRRVYDLQQLLYSTHLESELIDSLYIFCQVVQGEAVTYGINWDYDVVENHDGSRPAQRASRQRVEVHAATIAAKGRFQQRVEAFKVAKREKLNDSFYATREDKYMPAPDCDRDDEVTMTVCNFLNEYMSANGETVFSQEAAFTDYGYVLITRNLNGLYNCRVSENGPLGDRTSLRVVGRLHAQLPMYFRTADGEYTAQDRWDTVIGLCARALKTLGEYHRDSVIDDADRIDAEDFIPGSTDNGNLPMGYSDFENL